MSELIVALDVSSTAAVEAAVERLGDAVSFYKIGLELFSAEGPAVVKAVKARGKRVFLDLKLHDIPRTVERAVKAAGALGVDLMT
ncbi:MAG: orotidine 5'-phosphate decarboxylase, partial [Victivallales bacterium]|nr:orotidine 5'-phosphate decarboxylase [Victivallales bacterium]